MAPSALDPHVTYPRPPLGRTDERFLLARRLPKAELHMHHMGSLAPSEYARHLRLTEGRRLSPEEVQAAFDHRGDGKFFDDLDRAVRLWGDHTGIVLGALHMLRAAFDRGVRHVELLSTPDLHEQQIGLPPETLLRALAEAFAVMEDQTGLTGGIIVEMHRFDGRDRAVSLVRRTAPLREKGVPILGYGNDGEFRTVPFGDLADAYAVARAEGFRLTGHVDTLVDVEPALELGLDRFDHGWYIVDEPPLLQRLAKARTPMTLTPTSYAIDGATASMSIAEAWTVLTDAGVPVVLGTDDPELHHTDLAQAYLLMATLCDWSPLEMAAAAKMSWASAWLPEGSEDQIRSAWGREIDALVRDARAPERDPESLP